MTEAAFRKAFPGVELRRFESIDSTSSEARRALGTGLSGTTVFLAEEQTGGRGRHGHSFYSPKGRGIYVTIALPAEPFGEAILRVTAKTAVAAAKALRKETGKPVRIKWVNDLILNDSKIGGILTEHVLSNGDWLLVGIGINLFGNDFPEDLRGRAGSLGLPEGDKKEKITNRLLREVLAELSRPERNGYLKEYRAWSNVLGEEITFGRYDGEKEDTVRGRAVSIDENGGLVVALEDGSKVTLDSGEVFLRRLS